MWTTRLTPRLIWCALGLHLSLRLVALLLLYSGSEAVGGGMLDVLRVVGSFLAYALAFFICWNVAEEYRGTHWMRWAWLALTLDAGLSLLRPFSRPMALLGQAVDLYVTPPHYALFLHLVLVPANLCLLLGLLAIWWAYHETKLGFRLRRRDGVAITALFVLMLLFFLFRELLTEAQAVYRLTSNLQLFEQLQLFLIAAASLLLHRVSIQMGSGRLALVLRWMTIYALFRLGMVLTVSLARFFFPQQLHLITDLAEFGWQSAPWLFAVAVAYRAELTALAAARLKRVRENAPALVSGSL
ncbi:MAG: hypothetical protein U0Y68_19475 [Blastocatellia bacterium]